MNTATGTSTPANISMTSNTSVTHERSTNSSSILSPMHKLQRNAPGALPTPMIRCEDVSKSFGRTRALASVTLDVAPAEVVALIGASGSGKSTLLHCLSGLERPDTGSIQVLDQDLTKLREPHLTRFRRKHFGFVFQFPSLVPELSALENVALVGWLAGVQRNAARDAARLLLDQLGVGARADHVPGQLSGGEAQRVALARALVTSPQIIFADEPTGALDSQNATIVRDLLVTLAKERGCAVVLVTHDPTVAAVADRQLEMRDGTLRTCL